MTTVCSMSHVAWNEAMTTNQKQPPGNSDSTCHFISPKHTFYLEIKCGPDLRTWFTVMKWPFRVSGGREKPVEGRVLLYPAWIRLWSQGLSLTHRLLFRGSEPGALAAAAEQVWQLQRPAWGTMFSVVMSFCIRKKKNRFMHTLLYSTLHCCNVGINT